MSDTAALVRELDLEPHPEGGWYRRVWEHDDAHPDGRRLGSSILYLLDARAPSRWHRIDAAELWVHSRGAPLELEIATEEGPLEVVSLGGAGHRPQAVVAPGRWQRARVRSGWALVSCVVVPEFRFGSFELAPEGWEPGRPPRSV